MLEVGSTCHAEINGRRYELTITRVNEDGTINGQPVGSTSFLDLWESVTPGELSPDTAKTENPRDLYRLYWNGVRMGGREPSEVAPVNLEDLYAELRLADVEDPAATAALLAFEHHHALTVPATLRELFTRKQCLAKIQIAHCNAPEPQAPGDWELVRVVDPLFGENQLAVKIMLPHQGDHAWWAVFSSGADDAQIGISFDDEEPPLRLVATSLPFFFWDLRQAGRNWEANQAT